MSIKASELILNPNGSIYHLSLLPEQVADTIITVGDPNRVNQVTSFFDTLEFKTQNREFHTQTGTYKGKRITVISTGIGTDNIDIVLNELDALVNIDFKTRRIKEQLTTLNIIRIGTSGAIQKRIPVDSFLVSELAVGFDGLLHFYDSGHIQYTTIAKAILTQTNWYKHKSMPYVVSADNLLLKKLHSDKIAKGFTATNVGFYGPQGRLLRLSIQDKDLNNKLSAFNFEGRTISNMEMETAGIYGLSKLLGHKSISLNAIIANRITGEFSKHPEVTIKHLIEYTLKKLVS